MSQAVNFYIVGEQRIFVKSFFFVGENLIMWYNVRKERREAEKEAAGLLAGNRCFFEGFEEQRDRAKQKFCEELRENLWYNDIKL